jgi:hypothetical protein
MQLSYRVRGADGQEYGPAGLQDLLAWFQQGRLLPESEVTRSDLDYWAPARSFEELAASGLFIGCGLLARKGLAWVFVVGMVLYGLDGLLFLLVGDWFGLAFHVFVLFCLFKGLQAARGAGNNTAQTPVLGRPALR